MSMELDQLDKLAASVFDGYLVRKDLVRKYSRQYPVPTYRSASISISLFQSTMISMPPSVS
jgi:hypothetical protein